MSMTPKLVQRAASFCCAAEMAHGYHGAGHTDGLGHAGLHALQSIAEHPHEAGNILQASAGWGQREHAERLCVCEGERTHWVCKHACRPFRVSLRQ